MWTRPLYSTTKTVTLRLKEMQYEEVLRNKYGQWSCYFDIKIQYVYDMIKFCYKQQ